MELLEKLLADYAAALVVRVAERAYFVFKPSFCVNTMLICLFSAFR